MSSDRIIELSGDDLLLVHPDADQPTVADGWLEIDPKYIVMRDGCATVDIARMVGDMQVAA